MKIAGFLFLTLLTALWLARQVRWYLGCFGSFGQTFGRIR